jgi:hypothetical protein
MTAVLLWFLIITPVALSNMPICTCSAGWPAVLARAGTLRITVVS